MSIFLAATDLAKLDAYALTARRNHFAGLATRAIDNDPRMADLYSTELRRVAGELGRRGLPVFPAR